MKLSSKETLIAYITTLPENKCKEAYQILQERFEIHRKKSLLFNRQGVESLAPEGKIRLTPNQFKMVIETYGEQGFHRMCEILYDWLVVQEEKALYEVVARRRLKEYQKISHYYKLTKGWVAQRYEEELQRDNKLSETARIDENVFLNFEDVKTRDEALTYIKSIPRHLRFDNTDISYLVTEYDISNEELNEC